MKTAEKKYLLDLDIPGVKKAVAEMGLDAFRGRQLLKWVYEKKAGSFQKFSDLPVETRALFERGFDLRRLKITGKQESRRDGTVRYNFSTADGHRISAVFLPYEDRNSVCLSTQAGCPVGCAFCATGKGGFRRNLSRGEILEQLLQVENDTGRKITGVLLMGMGEPLLNYDSVVSALKAMTHPDLLKIGRRHITLSTVGIVPRIKQLAAADVGVKLAFSLHSADDSVRRKFIQPSKVPYMVDEILKACFFYARKTKSRLTIEYALMAGINDSMADARKLAALIEGHRKEHDHVQVNLIPCNPITSGLRPAAKGKGALEKPEGRAIDMFKNWLLREKILTVVREPRGADIGAACGQLGV